MNKSAIESIVRNILGDKTVRCVSVEPSVNGDDEQVVSVRIVYDEALGAPSAEDMIRVTSEIWRRTSETGSRAFPIPTFISSNDLEETKAA